MNKRYFIKNIFNRNMLSLLLILCFNKASGQQFSLRGKVTDSSKTAIQFSTITLLKMDNSIAKQTITDSLGLFEIKIEKGEYILVIDQFAKQLLKKNISIFYNTDLGNLEVTADVALGEVTIVSKKKIIEYQYDKIIFNVSNSPLKLGFDGLEVLKRSPGLRVNSQGNLLLRNENVLVLVNGRKINLSSEELNNYLSSLNSENIQRIEIQNLGMAETEAANSGGVVNIILKKIPTGFLTTLKASYSYRKKGLEAYSSGITNQLGFNKWSIYNKINYSDDHNLANFKSTTSFFADNGRNENFGYSNYQNKNFNTTTGVVFYPWQQHEIGAEVYYAQNKIYRNGLENLMVYSPALSAVSNNNSIYDNKNKLWNITLNYTFKQDDYGSYVKLIGDVGNNNLNNNNDVDTKYIFGTLNDNYSRYFTNAKSNFTNLQIDWLKKFVKAWEFALGAKYSQINRDNLLNIFINNNGILENGIGNQDFNNHEQIVSNYVTFAKQWQKKHSLKLGLRTEYTKINGTDIVNKTAVDKNYFDWFPSLFYNYLIKENHSISISYARRITRPSFRDLNPFVIKQNDFLFQTGNPNLQPQYTNKIDLNYNVKNNSFTLYGSFSNDLIVGVYTADNNITTYKPQNFGKSRNLGIDYSYNADINKWLYGSVSAGILDYNFEVAGIEHRRASFYSNIYARIKFNQSLFFDLFNNFFSKNQFFVTKSSSQYNLDITLQKNFWKDAGILKLSCSDIFNTLRDKNVSYYDKFNFSFYQKSSTRAFLISFIYTLKNNVKMEQKNIQSGNNNKDRL